MTNESVLEFDLPKNQSSVIKVIGVGGGVVANYMYENALMVQILLSVQIWL